MYWPDTKSIIRTAVLSTAVLLISASAAAQSKVTPPKAPAPPAAPKMPGVYVAQEPLSALGITGLDCRCSFTLNAESAHGYWHFRSEPEITAIDPDGPAAGHLKKGDVIVAVDGMLITTRAAGHHFSNVAPGVPVAFTVRRGNRTIIETIMPVAVTTTDLVELPGLLISDSEAMDKIYIEIEDMSKYLADIEMPEMPELPQMLDLPDLLTDDSMPAGWFGFGLSFKGSIKSHDDDPPAQWRFKSPPTIISVDPDSPAARAGLKEGDVLTKIDGARIDSNKGGKRFSHIEPGQTVEWTIKRNGKSQTLEMVAEKRPKRVDEPILVLPVAPLAPEPPLISILHTGPHKLRFTGSLGETDIEVHGDQSVSVIVDEESGLIIIKSRDATVKLRRASKKK